MEGEWHNYFNQFIEYGHINSTVMGSTCKEIDEE